MAVYERLSSDKKWPPESRKNRRQLQFGRYDYYDEDKSAASQPQPQPQQKRSAADVDAIVERLRQEIRRDEPKQPEAASGGRGHRTVSEAEAAEIFDRLRQCDFTRWPVESRVGRRELGQNRYDFYRGPAAGSGGSAPPAATKEELEAIIARLSTYDVAKTPPNSRALELKQMRAARGGPAA